MINRTPHCLEIRPGLTVERDRLSVLCQQWQIIKLELFGSVLRDDFRPTSDIDILATFHPTAQITFFDLDQIESQLSPLLQNRPIDLTTRRAIEQSHNPIRRAAILNHARLIYSL
ncbi:nucleotidyltransferase domain-containing protein [Spirulina major CS-329]|jgi:predicted nucleotidyltransferase|uniref:nucleotidyltransferase family protein n=1 Tax=Spirulina TaxID=1154 RepID=UPI00232CA409|nr:MULTISPECIES: nucleotidyltransferase domain-containing protein [Spirulina]MDB9496777.1 nucleotidyltransferase domain-containing protein [Spirulina subsalsa CS-330]MDB9501629.1 nucleotidyltransferase domain-containing protein [Spirulina major CS-329]